MNEFSKKIEVLKKLYNLPDDERKAILKNELIESLRLVSDGFSSYVALSDYEITPLKTLLIEPPEISESPFVFPNIPISVRAITLDELLMEYDVADHPFHGGAALGTEPKLLFGLLARFRQLRYHDISRAENWVWIGGKPYPIIHGKLHYFANNPDNLFLDKESDDWFELPITNRSDFIAYNAGDLDFIPPNRFAVTHSNGMMQGFTIGEGFVGPDDFLWLKALHKVIDAPALFEGLRKDDQDNMPRSLQEANASWVFSDKRFERKEDKPLITATHTYGLDYAKKGLIRLTRSGYSLVPSSGRYEKALRLIDEPNHMLFIIARNGNTMKGPWFISEDGINPTGPALSAIKVSKWGFAVNTGFFDERPVGRWRVVLKSTRTYADTYFLEPPVFTEVRSSLTGNDVGLLLVGSSASFDYGKVWGAIDVKTGKTKIPFEFIEFHKAANGCLIFTNEKQVHYVFDSVGYSYLPPMNTFKLPKGLCYSKKLLYKNYDSLIERREAYIKQDLPSIHDSVKAKERFERFDIYADRLGKFKGEITSSEDARLADLWLKKIEITHDIKRFGMPLKSGQQGIISFADLEPGRAETAFNWLNELPVAGLFPEYPGRVIGVEYRYLRLLKPKRILKQDIPEWLPTIRWTIWIIASLSLFLTVFWDGVPIKEILVSAGVVFILCWVMENIFKLRTK